MVPSEDEAAQVGQHRFAIVEQPFVGVRALGVLTADYRTDSAVVGSIPAVWDCRASADAEAHLASGCQLILYPDCKSAYFDNHCALDADIAQYSSPTKHHTSALRAAVSDLARTESDF